MIIGMSYSIKFLYFRRLSFNKNSLSDFSMIFVKQ